MFTEEQWKDIRAMGIKINKKTGNLTGVDANIFASYVKKGVAIIYVPHDFYAYKVKEGKWVKIQDMNLKVKLRDLLIKYSPSLWSKKLEDEYIEALKRTVFYDGKLDSDRRYINMLNGMYDSVTHELVEHNSKFYSTIQIPIFYDPEANCPNFEEFLDQSFLGDEESKSLSKEWLGYSMSAHTEAQKALVLFAKGRNGKGVFQHIVSLCAGKENVSNLTITDLSSSFMRSSLHNKLVNICSEMELSGKNLNTQYFKMITGQDEIMAEEKYKPQFSFKPIVKLIFSTNKLPHTKDSSLGFRRRLSILHFRNTVAEKDVDVNLKEKLEAELSGIFNLAMKGLQRLRGNNFQFTKCKVSEMLLREYEKDLNPMISFFEECIEEADEDYREDKKVAYNTFRIWADANGMRGYSDISTRRFWDKFKEQAEELGYKYKIGHSNKFNYIKGIRVIGEYKIDINNPIYRNYPLGG